MSTRGINKLTILGDKGFVALAEGNWDFLYDTSTIKHPDFNIGDRVALPDGRVFRYAKCDEAVVSYHAAFNASIVALFYEAIGVAASIGDRVITVTQTGFTADELRGGYVILYGASDAAQNRGIIGNDASGSTTTKIYLDAPLTVAVLTTTGVEIIRNLYANLTHESGHYRAVMGIPATNAAASSYVWIQTWGPCIVSGGEDLGPAVNGRELVFGGASAGLYKRSTYPYGQLAGFILESGGSVIPSIMLQISP